MTVKRRLAIVALLGMAAFAGDSLAIAADHEFPGMQSQPAHASEFSAQRRARPRIQVYRGRLLYRRCNDGYELQYRPSGTVLFPYMHCWWVRG
jgi:hypothetical protein